MDKWDLLHIGTAYVEVHTFKWKDYITVKDFSTTTNALSKEVLELEEENKNLKEDNRFLTKISKEYMKKENIIEVTEFTELYKDDLEEENKNLKEKVETLELWLDNKEKLNEEYRVKLDKYKKYYDRDKEELMESCYSLAKENDKLKSDLEECECSFWFENDEVWYRKREYKRLKKWIKDHCKWYWNLFPEDEMKRQRKKADKKRKKSDLYEDVK